jgi:hypothetical protein
VIKEADFAPISVVVSIKVCKGALCFSKTNRHTKVFFGSMLNYEFVGLDRFVKSTVYRVVLFANLNAHPSIFSPRTIFRGRCWGHNKDQF